MMLAVDVGDTEEPEGGSVVVSATVVGVEMNDPSEFVFGDAGFNVVVVGSSTGDERLVDDASVVDGAGLDEAGDVVAVGPAPGVVLVGDSVGSGASTLRLLPSDEPPQAATTRTRETRTRDKRFEITFETLFSFVAYGSSADEIGVAHHRQAQEEGLQEQLFVHVQTEAAHRRMNVVDGGSEFADAVGVVGM